MSQGLGARGHLFRNVKVTRLMNGVAAGTTNQNGSSVDMQGFEAVTFVALLGTLSATQVTSLSAEQSSDDGVGDAFTAIAGSDSGAMADADDDQGIILDIFRPEERYVRPVLNRATGNAVIDGIVAIQYGGRKSPQTHDATTIFGAEYLTEPVAGAK